MRITTGSPPFLSATDANLWIESAISGGSEVLGNLADVPVVIVELEAGDQLIDRVPMAFPCVVVVVARDVPTRSAPRAADLAICTDRGSEPKGWVSSVDLEDEVSRLASRIERHPLASVMLAQVLRMGESLDVWQGLLVESLAYSTLQSGPEFRSWLSGRRTPKLRTEPEEAVLLERAEDRLSITLNRPHVRNAVNTDLRDSLVEAFTLACADTSIESVELRASGPDFSSGGDLDEFGSLTDPAAGHFIRTVRSPARMLASISARVTAHVHGACVGAGIELASFAGRVVAAGDVRCQLPELGLGLLPGSGGTVSIPRRIGRHRTAWMGLSTANVESERALRWGLVDEVTR